MAIDLSNYVEVSERIETFRAKYPEGSYQTELVELPAPFADKFVAVKATVYRSPDDPTPGVDMAWEPVPGKTPYTKDSELQNACTSAIGRAIIAAGAADARRGIASQEEVRNQQPAKRQASTTATKPATEPPQPDPDLELRRWVAEQKLRLVEAFGGDKEKAKEAWVSVLERYSLAPDGLPSLTTQPEIAEDIDLLIIEALPDNQKPFT